jgi:hypothetical protein
MIISRMVNIFRVKTLNKNIIYIIQTLHSFHERIEGVHVTFCRCLTSPFYQLSQNKNEYPLSASRKKQLRCILGMIYNTIHQNSKR